MAHNVMRVDSMNDRYVTETMIDLNLDLNEEIDFDFFDNTETPSKEPLTVNDDVASVILSRSCSPHALEDDDDVQVSPHLLGHDLKLACSASIKDVNSSDSFEEPLSTGTENEEKFTDNFDEYETSKNIDDTSTNLVHGMLVNKPIECPRSELLKGSADRNSEQSDKTSHPNRSESFDEGDATSSISFQSQNDKQDEKLGEDASSIKSSISHNEVVSIKSSENLNEDASSKSSRSCRAEVIGSACDSDEGCPFEGSDSDELLLGVHTLTIIPRENEEETPRERTDNVNGKEMIHSSSCEKSATTARSSSGYSSASCRAHGCRISTRGDIPKTGSRQSSHIKINTPDMDDFIRSFRKIQRSTPVSCTSSQKYSTSKKRSRRNMSFSNEELQRIERENAILLNKIVLQQRARPAVVHKYERRVTSNTINRARQLEKIEYDNEILLKKIQDVKRKSSLSAQNSRCISQASSSQC